MLSVSFQPPSLGLFHPPSLSSSSFIQHFSPWDVSLLPSVLLSPPSLSQARHESRNIQGQPELWDSWSSSRLPISSCHLGDSKHDGPDSMGKSTQQRCHCSMCRHTPTRDLASPNNSSTEAMAGQGAAWASHSSVHAVSWLGFGRPGRHGCCCECY